MEKIGEALALLEQKRELFAGYRQETEALLRCDIDDIEAHLDRRDKIAREVDAVNGELQALGGALAEAAFCRTDHADLPPELLPVDAAARAALGEANRARLTEEQARGRVQLEHEELEKKIREVNRGPAAHAARYFTGISGAQRPGGGFKKA